MTRKSKTNNSCLYIVCLLLKYKQSGYFRYLYPRLSKPDCQYPVWKTGPIYLNYPRARRRYIKYDVNRTRRKAANYFRPISLMKIKFLIFE